MSPATSGNRIIRQAVLKSGILHERFIEGVVPDLFPDEVCEPQAWGQVNMQSFRLWRESGLEIDNALYPAARHEIVQKEPLFAGVFNNAVL